MVFGSDVSGGKMTMMKVQLILTRLIRFSKTILEVVLNSFGVNHDEMLDFSPLLPV